MNKSRSLEKPFAWELCHWQIHHGVLSLHACTTPMLGIAFTLLALCMSVPMALHAQTNMKDRYVTLAPGDQITPSIARPAQDAFTIVVWESEGDIMAQRIDNASGLPMWYPPDGVEVCTAPGRQCVPVAAYDSLDGVIVAWVDYRTRLNAPIVDSTGCEIYAHRLAIDDGSLDANWDPYPGGVAVTTNLNSIARDVRIAGTPDGAYLAWTDYRNSSGYPNFTNRDVYMQYLLSQTGSWPTGSAWMQNGVNIIPAPVVDQQHPELVLDFKRRGGKYGVLVVYESNPKNIPWQVYASGFDAGGNAVFQDLRVAPSGANQRLPQIASTGSWTQAPPWGALVVWEDSRSPFTGIDIYAGHIDEAGQSFWGAGKALCTAAGDQQRPRVVAQGKFGAAVWEDNRDAGATGSDIYINVVDMQNGNPYWLDNSASPICAYAEDQLTPELDFDPSGGMVYVCWEDQRDIASDPSDIYVQGFEVSNPSSLRWVDNGIPVTQAKQAQVLPRISGETIVWQDARRDPIQNDLADDENIYAGVIGTECDNPTDMRMRDVYVKHTQETDFAGHRFVVDAEGNRYVVWSEWRSDGTDDAGVYVQKLDRDGVPRWRNNGYRLNDPGTFAETPNVCVDDQGGAFVCWKENGSEITLARVDSSGIIAGPIVVQSGASEPRVVEDDLGNVYVGCIDPNISDVVLRKYSSVLAPLSASTPLRAGLSPSNLHMTKDRQRGVWCAWNTLNGGPDIEIGGMNASLTVTTKAMMSAVSGISSISGDFDIVTDVHPSDLAGNQKLFSDRLYDPLLAFTANYPSAGGTAYPTVLVVRCPEINGTVYPQGVVDLAGNTSSLASFHHPRIAVDSIPMWADPNSGAPEDGGAMVAWVRQYPNGGRNDNDVETNRACWTGPIGALTAWPFWTSAWSLDQGITFIPELGIATAFRSDPFGSRGNGLVVWETDQNLPCGSSPVTLGGNLIAYSFPLVDPRLWGSAGVAVSPTADAFTQTQPLLQTPCQNPPEQFFPLLWRDERSGTPCLVTTSVFDNDGYLSHDIDWRKEVAEKPTIAQSITIRIGDVAPQPWMQSRGSMLSVEITGADGWVTLDLVDITGRRVARIHDGEIGSSGGTVSWRSPALLVPGVYLLELRAGDTRAVQPIVITR